MKKFSIIFFVLFLCVSYSKAQENTLSASSQSSNNKEMKYLFKGMKLSLSGFLAPSLEVSQIQKELAASCGLNAALLFNQSFFIGLYGTSLMTNHYRFDLSNITGLEKPKIEFYHLGLYTGYIFASHQVFHAGIAARLGYGQISVKDDQKHYWEMNQTSETWGIDNVLVFSPQIELELNLTKFMKINVFGGYRMLSGVDKQYISPSSVPLNYYKTEDYNSFFGGMSLTFGFFGKKASNIPNVK